MTWDLSTHTSEPFAQLTHLIQTADAIVVGTGSGLSAAGGFTYHGSRFQENFADFIQEFGFLDLLHAALYDFPTWETYWAFQSRFILMNYFNKNPLSTYQDLSHILRGRNYFIASTNADNRYRLNDFDMGRVFQMQGQYGLMQCVAQCHDTLYEDEVLMWRMWDEQADLEIPSSLIPHCPRCGQPLEMNKRDAVRGMVEDDLFRHQQKAFHDFIASHADQRLLFLEIGVGFTTPQYIKRPFQEWVAQYPNSYYVTLNQRNYQLDPSISDRTLWIHQEIQSTLRAVRDQLN